MVHSCDLCDAFYNDEILLQCHKELYHSSNDTVYPSGTRSNILNFEILNTDDSKEVTSNKIPIRRQDEGAWSLNGHARNYRNSNNELELGNSRGGSLLQFESSSSDKKSDETCEDMQISEESSLGTNRVEVVSALNGAAVRNYRIKNHKEGLNEFLDRVVEIVKTILTKEITRLNVLKFNLALETVFTNEQDETSQRGFITRSRSQVKSSNLGETITECIQELILKITEHEARGSGWSLLKVDSIIVRVNKHGYGDRGSSYIPLPKKISDTKACINIQNVDNECFKYAMLVKFLSGENNTCKPSKRYKDVAHKYNFSKIKYPVSLSDVRAFERSNPGVSVNVFGLDDKNNVFPLKVVQNELKDHSDLLLLKKDDVSHFVYIKNFNRLVASQLSKHKHAITVCKRCFGYVHKAYNKEGSKWLSEHLRMCGKHDSAKIVLPTIGNNILTFNKISHQYKIPIAIYADFEASLLPVTDESASTDTQKMYQRHEPNSYCILLKSSLSNEHLEHYALSPLPKVYRGEHAAQKFLDDLYDICKKVELLYSYVVPMEKLSPTEELNFENADICYLCMEKFTDSNKKVRDHDHLTGYFRGAACNNCNINYKLPNFIPVIMHNLSRYDAHFIVPELGRDNGNIEVLATTNENFISFSKKVGKMKLRFLDSYRFIPGSLSELTENLEEKDFVETKKIAPKDHLPLVLRKGVFCYDYIDCLDKFDQTTLPPIESFYSKLNEDTIKLEDYDHACNVWNTLKIKTLGEYSDFYVKLDVTLLCDIMEEFRSTCLSAYGLDPFHSYTAPGLAWQAMMKETKCKLELLTDIDMLLMIESGVRGGLTQSVTRNVKGNNKYLKEYNPLEESLYIGYFDANNLYGWAMSNPLPYGGFKWVDPNTLGNIEDIPQNGDIGYFLECDIEYPEFLHDSHYDLPFLPQSEIPPGKQHPKLMATLKHKKRYVAHFWTIQQALKHKLNVTKVHRAIQFNQSCWLKPYIDSNTRRRTAARSSFQKKFYKDMNNSIFGKQLEDKRKHKVVKLVSSKRKLEKLVAKPNFNNSIIINNNLVAVCMDKTSVKMDRPIYSGMTILDISKTLMYDFHYNKMVKYYGRDNIGVAYMDTDAFVYWIKTLDMYKDLREFPYKSDFDFSDYPQDHPTYDKGVHKKVIGKFKDETNGNPIKEIICLAAKMYAMEIFNPKEKEIDQSTFIKKAKGVKNLYVKKRVRFEHYRLSLRLEKTFIASYNVIRSFNHKLFSLTETKKSISPYDDKRVILDDGIRTLPYGHYSLVAIDG